MQREIQSPNTEHSFISSAISDCIYKSACPCNWQSVRPLLCAPQRYCSYTEPKHASDRNSSRILNVSVGRRALDILLYILFIDVIRL